MTAARGIIHEEFQSTDFQQTGGVFEMCQLWLNLPAKHKMDPPKYQPILAKDIPVAPLAPTREADDEKLKTGENSIRVIAGDEATYGVKGAATRTRRWSSSTSESRRKTCRSTCPFPRGTTPSCSCAAAPSRSARRRSP